MPNDAITPFILAVPQADLEDLNRRIDQTRWPDAETVDDWSPERVLALKCGDRLNRVCATDRLRSCFRQAEVLHLTLLDELLHRSRHFFDRHVQIDTMLVKQIDRIPFEPLERRLRDLLDVLRATI